MTCDMDLFVQHLQPSKWVVQMTKYPPVMQEMQETQHALVPCSRRSLGEGNGNPLQYSCLKNRMDRGTWRATVHGVTKSQTQLKLLSTHACIHVVQPTCQSDLACTEMNMCLENTWFAVVKFVVSHIYKSISMLGIHNTEFKAGERTYSEIADI